jgi:hypothetical protein
MIAIVTQDNATAMPASLDGGRWTRIGTDAVWGTAAVRQAFYYRNVPGAVGAVGGEVANQILSLGVTGRHMVQIRKIAQGTFEPTSAGILDSQSSDVTVAAGTPTTGSMVFGTPTPNNTNSKVLLAGGIASGSTGATLGDRLTAPGTATDVDDLQNGTGDTDRMMFSAFVPATAANTPLPAHTFTVKDAAVGGQGSTRLVLIIQPVGGNDPAPGQTTNKPTIMSGSTSGISDPTVGLVATANTPIGTGVGDRLVAALFVENSGSPPASITSTDGLIFNRSDDSFPVGATGTYRVAFYYHNVTSTLPATLTFPTGFSGRHMVHLHRIQTGTFNPSTDGFVNATSVDHASAATFPTTTSNNTNSRALLAFAFGSGSGATAGSRVTFTGGTVTKLLETQNGTTATDNLFQTAWVDMPTSGSPLAAITGTVASPAAGTHPAAAALLVMQPVGGTDIAPIGGGGGATPGALLWTVSNDRNLGQDWSSVCDYSLNSGQVTTLSTSVTSRSPRFTYVTSPAPLAGSRTLKIVAFSGDRDAYTSSAQRSELGHDRTFGEAPTNRTFTNGMEVWYGYSLYIPSSYPTVSNWFTCQQGKVIASGNGPFSLYFENGRLKWNQSNSQTYGSTDIITRWTDDRSGGTARDVWHKMLVHIKWSTGSDGFVEVFGDTNNGQGFRTILPRINRWTLKYFSDGGPAVAEVRCGIYRQALARDDTMYFGRFACSQVTGGNLSANARAAVTTFAYGQNL